MKKRFVVAVMVILLLNFHNAFADEQMFDAGTWMADLKPLISDDTPLTRRPSWGAMIQGPGASIATPNWPKTIISLRS